MSRLKLNLEQRLSFTIAGYALVVAILIGGVGYYVNEKIESRIWEQTLESELKFHLERQVHFPNFQAPDKYLLRVFEMPANGSRLIGVPNEVTNLQVGLHDEFVIKDKEYCILVKDIENTRYFILYDITDLEREEKNLFYIILTSLCIGLVFYSDF